MAISVFVFLVLSYLPPDISILLLNGVFLAQIGIDVLRTPCRQVTTRPLRPKQLSGIVFENRTIKLIALGVHFAGIVTLAVYVGYIMRAEEKLLRSVIAFPIVLIAMSIVWCDPVQRLMAKTKKEFRSARYKLSKSSVNILAKYASYNGRISVWSKETGLYVLLLVAVYT